MTGITHAVRRLACALPLATCALGAAAQSAATATLRRDARRETLVLSPHRIVLAVQADAPGQADAPEIRYRGKRLRFKLTGRQRYGGELPGEERRYAAPLPSVREPDELEIRERHPDAALLLSVSAPLCLREGGTGRLLVDRDGVQAAGEIFPGGAPVHFTLGVAGKAGCHAPVLPPPPEGGRRNAHLNHAPRHDGVFFMAADGFHHLEMTCACGRLALYLYDDRVLPLPAAGCRARFEGLSSVDPPLVNTADSTRLEAALPAGAKPPLDFTLRASLAPGLPEERFDFHFPFCEACAK